MSATQSATQKAQSPPLGLLKDFKEHFDVTNPTDLSHFLVTNRQKIDLGNVKEIAFLIQYYEQERRKKWQPASEAPKGTPVYVYTSKGLQLTGRWTGTEWKLYSMLPPALSGTVTHFKPFYPAPQFSVQPNIPKAPNAPHQKPTLKSINTLNALHSTLEDSMLVPQLFFKWKIGCGRGETVRRSLINKMTEVPTINVIEIGKNKSLSTRLANLVNVVHQSPQILLIHQNRCILHQTGYDITIAKIEEEYQNILSNQPKTI